VNKKVDAGMISIFRHALEQEKTGISFFEASLDRMQSASAVAAFKLLIEEEYRHVEFIDGIISDLTEAGELDPATVGNLRMDHEDFFESRADSERLEQSVDESMTPDMAIFNTAWLIEKDLSEYYANAAKSVDDPWAKEALNKLSEWEKGHEVYFRGYREQLREEYGKMPWGG